MDIRQLEAFVYTVKYQSFSLAAQKLYLSQPTVSSHINNLEKELHRSLELPLKSSRLQVHGCFLDGSAICNKMNAQYVPVGRGLGLYSLFLDMKNTLRVFRVLFFTLSTLGVAYQTPHQSAVSAVQWAERCAAFPDKECRTADRKGRREASFKPLRPPQREGTNLRKFLPPS